MRGGERGRTTPVLGPGSEALGGRGGGWVRQQGWLTT
jgi:hypothetical protein